MPQAPIELAEPLASACAATRFRSVFQAASLTSTNAVMAQWARQGREEGAVLVADEQTAGRGRRDRTWESPAGASVSMSVLLRPHALSPQLWGWLSLLAGMAVTTGLRDLSGGGERICLKWPNDVLIDGLKVCGILSERLETPPGPAAVVGIGINLAQERGQLPVQNATSLAAQGLPYERDAVVASVLRALDPIYGSFLSQGAPVARYQSLCASVGAPLTVHLGGGERVTGIGIGADANGRLLVDVDGDVRAFAVGDVVHARLG